MPAFGHLFCFAETSADLFSVVLVQLIIIIAAARVFAILFRYLKQPPVVGEILGGIILGPSLLKPLMPEVWESIFRPEAEPIFFAIKELGLMLLLFIVGMEFDFSLLRHLGKSALAVSVVGVLIPFALGMGLGFAIAENQGSADPSNLAFFLGTAFSVTALPVLGRILMELGITKTHIGTVAISAAAVSDAVAWILLANLVFYVRHRFDAMKAAWMVLLVVVFLVGLLWIIRPVLLKLLDSYFRRNQDVLETNGLAAFFVILLLCGLATLKIGIFAIFGAFMLGAALSGHRQLHHAIGDSFRNFVSAFFLPVFFTYTGLRTDVGMLACGWQWLLCGLISLVAIIGKWGSCTLAARYTGFAWREANCIGVLMNTRGLMELIVINVGYDLGIIDRTLFTILVLMAIVTNIMTTPLLLWLRKGTELEEKIKTLAYFKK